MGCYLKDVIGSYYNLCNLEMGKEKHEFSKIQKYVEQMGI
jgi:hypothetical protein